MKYTPEQVISARDYAALVVAKHGEGYLPIFEQLEREVANRYEKENALARALRIAEQHLAA